MNKYQIDVNRNRTVEVKDQEGRLVEWQNTNENGRNKRVSKTILWQWYFGLNKLKAMLYMTHCAVSTSKWESSWLAWIEKRWQQNEEELDWYATNVVYMCVISYSRYEYVGESSVTLEERIKTHMQCARSGASKQKFYLAVRDLGMERLIWYPVPSWRGRTTKYKRLFEEAKIIWERDPKFNSMGTQGFRDDKGHEGELLMGKRKRFKAVKRLSMLQRCMRKKKNPEEEELKNQNKINEMRLQGKIFRWIARLARRPMKTKAGFGQLKIVKQIREQKLSVQKRLIRMGHKTLDPVNQSIFMHNMHLILNGHTDCIVTSITIISTVMRNKRIQGVIKKKIQSWLNRWERKGVLVMVKTMIVKGASESLISRLGNTHIWGYRMKEEAK